MTALGCLVAHHLVNHRALGSPIRRYGHGLLPWVLIAIGIAILVENDLPPPDRATPPPEEAAARRHSAAASSQGAT
ncbi:cadmium resistance transporter [Stigmatella aurantiaca DW4/3-1]|nr:cadmium resistance transporter [Stigmatella aurantiaca DW4/3-1]